MVSDSQPGARRRPFDHPYLLLALASLFWSGNHIVGRAVAGHVPPYALSTLRWLVGAVMWTKGTSWATSQIAKPFAF